MATSNIVTFTLPWFPGAETIQVRGLRPQCSSLKFKVAIGSLTVVYTLCSLNIVCVGIG